MVGGEGARGAGRYRQAPSRYHDGQHGVAGGTLMFSFAISCYLPFIEPVP